MNSMSELFVAWPLSTPVGPGPYRSLLALAPIYPYRLLHGRSQASRQLAMATLTSGGGWMEQIPAYKKSLGFDHQILRRLRHSQELF